MPFLAMEKNSESPVLIKRFYLSDFSISLIELI